jgi:glycosyltransferase involved in cell wall biosynthesis
MVPFRSDKPKPLMRRPRVSVVVPLHNYGHFLTACVESVLAQEHVDIDVLIIDDASTDDSLAVARQLASSDARVRIVANDPNQGMAATINDGLWAVEGEYVVKMDADDMLTPGALGRATALLDAYPSVGFTYGFPVAFWASVPPPARTKVRSWTVWPGYDWLKIRCLKGRNCILQPEVVMRASVLREAGKYNAEMGHAPDFDMWLRLAAISDVGRVNGAHQGYYRAHPDSWQRAMANLELTDLEIRLKVFTDFFQGAGAAVPDAAALFQAARRAIAVDALDDACLAYEQGRVAEEPIDEYVALALDAWPNSRSLRKWRSLERWRATRTQGAGRAQITSASRFIENRLRWRRWQWTGV